MYLEALDLNTKELTKEVAKDSDSKQILDAIKFTESVLKGDTVVQEIPMTEDEIKKLKEEEENTDE